MGSIPRAGRCPGKGMATHSRILARRIPWIEETGGLLPWGHRVGHNWNDWEEHTQAEINMKRYYWNQVRCVLRHFYRVWLFATLWTITRQAPLFMGFPRQEYLPGVGCHSLFQGIFLTQGLNLRLLPWQADSLLSEPSGKPLKWSDAQIKKGGECHSGEEKEPQEARFLNNPTLPLKTN